MHWNFGVDEAAAFRSRRLFGQAELRKPVGRHRIALIQGCPSRTEPEYASSVM